MKIRTSFTAALIVAGLLAAPLGASAQQILALQTAGGTTYLNGGIGEPEADAMRRMANEFPLRLTFSEGPLNEFTTGVPVVISDARGNPVFELPNAGPLLYVVLPDGKYQVSARAKGRTETQEVTVAGNQGKDVNFHWAATPAN